MLYTVYILLYNGYLTVICIEDITWWREDMNHICEWQDNILRTSAVNE